MVDEAGTTQQAGTVTAEQAMLLLLLDRREQLKALERAGAISATSSGRYWLKDLVQGYIRHIRKPAVPVSSAAMAQHLDCAPSYVRKLVDQGVIERRSDGKFDLDRCRTKYLAHLREARKVSPRGAVDSAFTAAKTALVQLRVAERAGKLIPGEQHDARCEEITGTFLAALSSMAAQVAINDLSMRRRLERWVYDTRMSITKVMLAKADAEGEEAQNGTQGAVRGMPERVAV